ncbi:MAG TPA: carboxylesterase family protein, partial [Mycobacterium sp.]|nr:carboxylesterase family protein [Mycobacterium sp.]
MAVLLGHSTIAHTGLGDLRGTTEGGVGVWRGVPYAEQPVGERRFLAPAPLPPWTGVRDALEHGPLPPQGKSFVGGGRDDPKVRDEACLTLTVWSPDTSGSLPVMVWIPGGAFVYGAGQFQLYNGSRLAANGNVVVVNVTYRIGVFGGFELSDLGDGFDDNLALRDQMAALRWIQENIAAFGGDPDRVTAFGESAGATSVLALLASPAAGGLFSRAIAQSPALPLIAGRELRARQAHEFLQRLGVSAAEVKGLPQRQLRRAAGLMQLKSAAKTPTLAYGLTYGVDLLPNHPVDAARAGTLARGPLIIGTNS